MACPPDSAASPEARSTVVEFIEKDTSGATRKVGVRLIGTSIPTPPSMDTPKPNLRSASAASAFGAASMAVARTEKIAMDLRM